MGGPGEPESARSTKTQSDYYFLLSALPVKPDSHDVIVEENPFRIIHLNYNSYV